MASICESLSIDNLNGGPLTLIKQSEQFINRTVGTNQNFSTSHSIRKISERKYLFRCMFSIDMSSYENHGFIKYLTIINDFLFFFYKMRKLIMWL